MNRDAVFELIRDHLADELDIDPARVQEGSRFKEDLEADSLDLYTLVQELEDSYGVTMTDEQATRDPDRRVRPSTSSSRTSPSRGPDP